jgi:Late embryogenesis abundant (LEA) group 1
LTFVVLYCFYVEKMKTRDPMQKATADEHKEERKMGAEAEKQTEKQENAATTGTGTGHTAGTTGAGMGHHTTGGFGSSV